MTFPFPWTALVRDGPVGPLGQLHRELVAVADRVRVMVAEAISHAVASAARHTVLALLGQSDAGLPPPRFPTDLPGRPQPLWRGRDESQEWDEASWVDEPPDWGLPQEQDPEDERLLSARAPREDAVLPLRPWRPTLVIAFQAVAWWLWRQAGRWPVRAALGFGLACGLALYLSGALLETRTGLALTLLTDTLGAVTAT